MSKVINLFPLSVLHDSIRIDVAERDRLVDAIMDMGRRKLQQSAGAAWTGDLNGYDFLHNDPRFQDLFAKFTDPLGRYLDLFGLERSRIDLYYTRSWGTISRRGESTQAHTHMQSHISLVYYLKKPPGSSSIQFTETDAPNEFAPNLFHERMLRFGILKEIQQYNARRVFLDPVEGDVLIFPSKAPHAIGVNQSDEPRISIAVDIVLTVRDSEGLEYLLPSLETWKRVG
jgi:uncharacterized protein (TIGR02466 family)